MGKSVNRLVDLEIDEVSVVDRAANQHSLIAFSKSLALGGETPEDHMPATFYLEDGTEISEEDLQPGDLVVDEDGNETLLLPEDFSPEDFDGDFYDDEVGKADWGSPARAARAASRGLRGAPGPMGGPNQQRAYDAGRKVRNVPASARRRARQMDAMARGAYANANYATNSGIARAGSAMASRPFMTAGLAGAGGTAAGAAGMYGYDRMKKSLGSEILEEFSKAVTDRDREQVIAKMANEVDRANMIAEEAMGWAESEHEARMDEVFVSKAAEYNLPVDPYVLGPILKSMAATLDEDQLEVVDALFNAVGDALYEEVGYVGESSNSSVLDQVSAFADEFVSKSDATRAQAMTAMFEANPMAYDAYLSEIGR